MRSASCGSVVRPAWGSSVEYRSAKIQNKSQNSEQWQPVLYIGCRIIKEVIMGKKNRHKCKAPYRAPPQCGKYQKKLMKAAAVERQRKRRRS